MKPSLAARAGTRVTDQRSGRLLPTWPSVLAVVAHPDDESFGLGALVDALATAGTQVHILCYTHGEASTLNETGSYLYRAREAEFRAAGAELGAASVTLLDYPDGGLDRIAQDELAAHAASALTRYEASGLLVFDETGVTGHPDHRAATAAAVLAGRRAGLPVLAWALPDSVAAQLTAETGQRFAGRPQHMLDLCVRVDRRRQRSAARLHASQISPGAVLWRRLQLQGECEHLRWLVQPAPRPAG